MVESGVISCPRCATPFENPDDAAQVRIKRCHHCGEIFMAAPTEETATLAVTPPLQESAESHVLLEEATESPSGGYALRDERPAVVGETVAPVGTLAVQETAEPSILQEEAPAPSGDYVLCDEEDEEIAIVDEAAASVETPAPVEAAGLLALREDGVTTPAPDYVVREEGGRTLPEQRYLIAHRGEERAPEVVTPPDRGWFLFGVFTFPWWGEARSRWATLCIFFVPALFVVAFMGFMNVSGLGWAIPYLIVPLVWVLLWVLSYAAGCFVAIIQDTGSGNDEVENWPDGDWRERIGTLLHVGLHLCLAMGAGFALTWPVSTFVASGLGAVMTGLAANFLFPLFLLSSMEADTLLMPYSPMMLRSLLKTPGGWCIIYFESLVVLLAVGALLGLGVLFFPLATIFLASPLLATAVFIQGRLYGRLAWHIGQTQGQGKKRKRKKKTSTDARPAERRTEVDSKA